MISPEKMYNKESQCTIDNQQQYDMRWLIRSYTISDVEIMKVNTKIYDVKNAEEGATLISVSIKSIRQ